MSFVQVTSGIFYRIPRESLAELFCTMSQKIRSLDIIDAVHDGKVGCETVELH